MNDHREKYILPPEEPPEQVKSAVQPELRPVAPPTHSLVIPVTVGGVFLLAAVLFVVFTGRGPAETRWTPSPVPVSTITSVSPTPLRETIIVTATPVPTPDCVSAQAQLAEASGLAEKGDWEGAGRESEATLTIGRLCESDRKRLMAKAVIAGLNVLYSQKFEPLDIKSHQQEVDRYLALRERARLADVDFPTPLQVARASFSISQFRLTIAALEVALSEGDYNPKIDRDMTKMYISALFNLGDWYTQAAPGSNLYNDGLSYLSASHRLAVEYKTGQGEAAMLLARLLGADETAWPGPYHSPLFTAKL